MNPKRKRKEKEGYSFRDISFKATNQWDYRQHLFQFKQFALYLIYRH